jgi:hypothetical protein
VTRQVEDAYDTKVAKRCASARYYIFNDEPESEEYVFGFKSALKYMKTCPVRARSAIFYRHGYEGKFSAKDGNSLRRGKRKFLYFISKGSGR